MPDLPPSLESEAVNPARPAPDTITCRVPVHAADCGNVASLRRVLPPTETREGVALYDCEEHGTIPLPLGGGPLPTIRPAQATPGVKKAR